MAFKAVLTLSVLALAASAAVVPKSNNGPAAAAYFINNEPSGNEVVVLAVDASGQASFSSAVSAGGKGLHANSTGPDSTFSQNAILVAGRHLFAVNPGSNTVAMFAINPNDPSNITMVGKPAPSMGEFPMAIAAHPKLPLTCTLNGGAQNGVGCHIVDPVHGLLPIMSSMRNLNVTQTTPPTGPPGSFADILFSNDGRHLFVSLKGNPGVVNGTMFAMEVNSHGVLSQTVTTNMGGPVPFSMTNIPGGQAVFLTEATGGVETFDFTGMSSFSGVNAAVTKINNTVATCWSAFSQTTGNFFIDDAATGIVSEISLDKSLKPTLVAQYPLGGTTATLDNAIATIDGKEFLMVLQANATAVSVLRLDAPGQAKVTQQLDLSGSPVTLSVNMIGMAAFSKHNWW
ncbi:hypothetical protein DACRYDRAFT_100598 [Dacryopinax primogenitus]|uniref:Isomerase YbhE n=1 Tax=Dacryopinax primogenitus (strain DJM 731) TaxID=1858805 RepID=M5G5L0_DACPD|nr:uncharacterized protein DACRYDRAFT_100598 [Dacryopinax primogenitus]EJU01092.1 hypothetical protein DACRYDRAFT_100598 [Dacryopinax primogenitus]